MIDFFLNTMWGWMSITSIVVIGCVVVAWFIPSQRWAAIVTAAGAILATFIYAKGASDAKRREREKSERAVANVQAKYSEIDSRSDGPDDIAKRLHDGKF